MAMRELERSVAVRVCVGVERLFLCKPFSLTLYICIAASQANENALLIEPKYPDANLRIFSQRILPLVIIILKLINCMYIDVHVLEENWRYLF